METNKFIDRNKLRREALLRNTQNSNQTIGKKSLSKRIIKERAGLTYDNVVDKINFGLALTEIDEMLSQIMYHVKFAADAYPSTFNAEKINEIKEGLKGLRAQFAIQLIDEKEYIKMLKYIDKQIMDRLDNLSQCR
jgi:hypothetical protein